MDERTRQPYPSDLSDAQWEQLAPLIPPKVGKGRNRTVNLREAMNAILYVLRTGCQWDCLPRAPSTQQYCCRHGIHLLNLYITFVGYKKR